MKKIIAFSLVLVLAGPQDCLAEREDAPYVSGSNGTTILGVRQDADTSPVSASGDNHTLIFDNAGNLKVNVKVDDAGIGGGVQYTEGDADATITGTAIMWEDTSNTLVAPSATKPLPVGVINLPTLNINNVSGTVSLPTGASTSANQTTIIGHVDGVEGILTTIDTDTGNIDTSLNTIEGAVSNARIETATRMGGTDCATVTRPANTTGYTANDAVSNNATAGSVTAPTCTVTDTNDLPVAIERFRLRSTDTGVAGKTFRAWFYRADPTASSGIVGGDNAAFSTKQGSFIGTMSGVFRTFSDGSVAVLVPDEGSRIIAYPVSGAATLYVLYQTLQDFTPSANSTTFIGTPEIIQGTN